MTKPVTQFIARQAILDASKQIFAYELRYRDSENNAFPVGVTDEQATGRMFFNSLILVGKDKLVANHCAFINLSDTTLLQEITRLLKPDNLVLECVERSQNIEELLAIVKTLRKQNYKFALDDYDKDPRWEPLLPYMSYVKLELEHPILKTTTLAKKLKRLYPKLKIVVERIETYEDFNYIQQAGVDLFQGYFFAKPEMVKSKSLPPSEMALAELLYETSVVDVDIKKITSVFERDVNLSYKLLRYSNSAAFKRRAEINTIKQAVVVLGNQELKKFLSLLFAAQVSSEKPIELIKLSLTRARFCELLAQKHKGIQDTGMAFLVGMMSLMDAILDESMEGVMKKLPLSNLIKDALVQKQGILAQYLGLIKAYEQADWELTGEYCERIKFSNDLLPEIYNQAVTWGNEQLQVMECN